MMKEGEDALYILLTNSDVSNECSIYLVVPHNQLMIKEDVSTVNDALYILLSHITN